MTAPDAWSHQAHEDRRLPRVAYALGMVVLLVLFSIGGDNGALYAVSLLGVPIVSGVLTGLGMIRFWHATLGCLAVVVLDVIFDETRAEDVVFFVVLAVMMVGLTALARWVTRRLVRQRRRAPEPPATG
jgi:hypothetical protein